jgi:uncharacterized protein
LADTGPIVAFLDRKDKYHEWAVARFRDLPAPFYTCESVLSEGCFLLRRVHGGVQALGEMVRRGALRIDFDLAAEWDAVHRLLRKYDSVPASLADACLVRMSELHPKCTVLTIDSDFRHYRRSGRSVIPTADPRR